MMRAPYKVRAPEPKRQAAGSPNKGETAKERKKKEGKVVTKAQGRTHHGHIWEQGTTFKRFFSTLKVGHWRHGKSLGTSGSEAPREPS